MALMGIIRGFEATHGSRERRSDVYTIEIVIEGPIENGFVAGVDYAEPIKRLDQLVNDFKGAYLDEIVGRATNENIAQFLMFNLSSLPIHKIQVTENNDRYVELYSDEFDIDAYPAQLAFNKGHSHLLKEEPEIAKKYFTEAIEMNSDFVEAYNLRGRCSKYMGDFEEALLDFQRAIEIKPDFGEAWRNIGNAHLHLEMYGEMIPAFDKAVELMPNSALAINNRGYGYYVKEDFDLALKDHTTAVEIDPNYAEAYYDKAMALKALGKRALAKESLLESRRLKQSGEDTFHEIKMY